MAGQERHLHGIQRELLHVSVSYIKILLVMVMIMMMDGIGLGCAKMYKGSIGERADDG